MSIIVTKLENGVELSGLPVDDFDIYEGGAWQLLCNLAEVLGVHRIALGMLQIQKFERGVPSNFAVGKEQVWYGIDRETVPAEGFQVFLDQTGWFWDEEHFCWSHYT